MALPKRPRSSTVLCTSSIGWDVPGLFGLIRQCSYICSWIWKRKFGSGNMANVFFIYKKDPCYLYTKTYLVPLPTGPFWPRTVAQILAACILMVLWTPSLDIQEETASEWLGLWLVNTGKVLKTHGASWEESFHVGNLLDSAMCWHVLINHTTPCNHMIKHKGPTPFLVSSGDGVSNGRIFCWARQSITMHALVRDSNSLSRSLIPSSTQKVEP